MKKILQFLKQPNALFLALWYIITAGAIAFTIVCLIYTSIPQALCYISYALSAVTFAYAVYTLVILILKAKNGVKSYLRKYKYTGRLLDDYAFRTIIFAVGSLGICTAYAVFNAFIGGLQRSVWYGAPAAYYIMLVIMRSVVINYHLKKRKRAQLDEVTEKRNEAGIYRICGILLVLLPVCLYFAIIPMISGKNSFSHPGLMIYVSALYAFIKVIMSIYNIFKAHRNDDYTVRAIRGVNLADAIVSILALQTAMLTEFSTDAAANGTANALTGAAVCLLTIVIGTFMIVSSTKIIKKLKTIKTAEEV